MGYDFISVGEMVIDFIRNDEKNCFVGMSGGAPANAAIMVAKNGYKSGFYGKFSTDLFGDTLLKELMDAGVTPLCKTRTDDYSTTFTFVFLDASGERKFLFPKYQGADWLLSKEDIEEAIIRDARIVHFGLRSLLMNPICEALDDIINIAEQSSGLISCDVNYRAGFKDDKVGSARMLRERLPKVDLLKVSEEEAFLFGGSEKLPQLMKENNIPLLVETLGGAGARCFYKDEVIYEKGFQIKAVDTTGAGDSFWGSFLSSFLSTSVNRESMRDLDPEFIKKALRYANASACLTVKRKGAIAALPSKEEILKFLEEH